MKELKRLIADLPPHIQKELIREYAALVIQRAWYRTWLRIDFSPPECRANVEWVYIYKENDTCNLRTQFAID